MLKVRSPSRMLLAWEEKSILMGLWLQQATNLQFNYCTAQWELHWIA